MLIHSNRLLLTLISALLFISVAQAQSYEPDPQQQTHALAFAESYFQAQQAREFEQSYLQLAPSLQDRMTLQQWTASQEKFFSNAGSYAGSALEGMRWHLDPKHADLEGIYAELLYSCHYAYLNPCEETLMLYSEIGEKFSVIRHERYYVNIQTGKKVGKFLRLPFHRSSLNKIQ